jgi:hypothetical protein
MQLAQLVKIALDETRMIVLGAQILLGFEFSGVFRDGFESLPMHARYLDGIVLLLMIITVAFLITPESYDQNCRHRDGSRARPPVDFAYGKCLIAAVRAQSGNRCFYHWRTYFWFLSWPAWRLLFHPSRPRLLVPPSISAAAANGS